MDNQLLIILILFMIVVIWHINMCHNDIEQWRDLSFIGNKDLAHYQNMTKNSNYKYSRKNMPVYYPISSPLAGDYNNYVESLTSPKLSYLRIVLNKIQTIANQGIKPTIFNYAERPITYKKADMTKLDILADTIIKMINDNGKPLMKVEKVDIINSINEETDAQSRIIFDLKIKMYYNDIDTLTSTNKFDIIYIQPEFIFENLSDTEANFFKNYNAQKIDFKVYIAKIIVIGAENMGFLAGTSADSLVKD